MKNKGRRGWFGDPEEHAEVGERGGKARKRQMEQRGESYEQLGHLGGKAAQQSGKAHKLTDTERARGGKRSHRGGVTK